MSPPTACLWRTVPLWKISRKNGASAQLIAASATIASKPAPMRTADQSEAEDMGGCVYLDGWASAPADAGRSGLPGQGTGLVVGVAVELRRRDLAQRQAARLFRRQAGAGDELRRAAPPPSG